MQVSELKIADLDRIKPLWLALHAHHGAIAPQLSPYIEPDQSWCIRRSVYSSMLSQGGKIFVVSEGADLIGYASATKARMPWPATFQTDAQVVELMGLSVRSDKRGTGIGTRLLTEVDKFAESLSLPFAMVGIVHGNTQAARLYSKHGFTPTWSLLTNFGRPVVRLTKNHTARIRPLDPEEVVQLRTAWLQVHRHHQAVAPQLAPYVSDDRSWAVFEPTVNRRVKWVHVAA